MAVLETEEISIRFGGLQALDSVSCKVNKGEIVGLIGPNGAGKTTFFNCITGFYKHEGRVIIEDEDVTSLRPDERTRRGLARTFQHVGLVRSFTVLENLLVAQHRTVQYGPLSGLFGAPWAISEDAALRRRARIVLGYFELDHLASTPLSELSYGHLKQVEVAAVLCTDPNILMLDEPLAGLAPEESEQFGQRLLRMREELELTIVIIEHHVPFMLEVCDYLYALNFGQCIAKGKPDEVRTNRNVAEAYMGEGAVTLE